MLPAAGQKVDLVYFAPVGPGGLARYAVAQCAALAQTGCQVIFLGRSHMRSAMVEACPGVRFIELCELPGVEGRVRRLFRWIRTCRRDVLHLCRVVEESKPPAVLITAFAEYFSPVWSGLLLQLRKAGVRIGVVVHDPVRDFCVGPRWWHRFCVSNAYSCIDVAFAHDETPLDTGHPCRDVCRAVIPMGCFTLPLPDPAPVQREVRQALEIPAYAKVALSFGHIRDGKNLDLVIAAMVQHHDLHLLVVGKEQSTSQKPMTYYQAQAEQLGVAHRCHWVHGFVSHEEAHRYFIAADFILLLYSADFKSASAVLNDAAQFSLKVVCSSGGGPLQSVVEKYKLGCWVPPDDISSISLAFDRVENQLENTADWDSYRVDHCWLRNAHTVQQFLLASQ